MEEREAREQEKAQGTNNNYEMEKQRKKQVEQARMNVIAQKRGAVKAVNDHLRTEMQRKERMMSGDHHQKVMQRETVRQMAAKSKQTVEIYKS